MGVFREGGKDSGQQHTHSLRLQGKSVGREHHVWGAGGQVSVVQHLRGTR